MSPAYDLPSTPIDYLAGHPLFETVVGKARRAGLDTEMLLASAGDLRFDRNLGRGLFPVGLFQSREEIAFAVLAAKDERDPVIKIPGVSDRIDLSAGQMANAILSIEDAHTHPVGHLLVIMLANPLRDASAHGASPVAIDSEGALA
jgi:hypothetical protein